MPGTQIGMITRDEQVTGQFTTPCPDIPVLTLTLRVLSQIDPQVRLSASFKPFSMLNSFSESFLNLCHCEMEMAGLSSSLPNLLFSP